jgi:hypothetical protein
MNGWKSPDENTGVFVNNHTQIQLCLVLVPLHSTGENSKQLESLYNREYPYILRIKLDEQTIISIIPKYTELVPNNER